MHPRFQTAFAQLADNLQSALEPILADKYFPALLTGEQVSSLKSATGLDEDALAFALLPLAAACARTPLSNFNVGAIARGVSGTWYFGANMEFIGATMQQTVHAEQSAISHAWLSGEKALAAITVNYRIVEDMASGLSHYLADQGFDSLQEMVGLANNNIVPAEDLDRSYIVYPRINLDKCVGCGRCYISCYDGGHQAMEWSEKTRTPHCNTEKCVGCLLCGHVCPVGCIELGEVKFKKGEKEHPVTL
ncbi:dihydropyrimidine dehydrogenase [Escherichia coli]|nr:cytidine deaminase [Escherichia coli]STG94973.1 dihydropyrimidine dehydrogenase [Escherichia coli]